MASTRPASPAIIGNLPRVEYDHVIDTLFLRLSDAPAMASHVVDEMWVLKDPQTNEFRGIFVEDFERVFLKRHPELELAWRQANPPLVHRWSTSMWEAFTRVFVGWLRRENKDIGQAICPA